MVQVVRGRSRIIAAVAASLLAAGLLPAIAVAAPPPNQSFKRAVTIDSLPFEEEAVDVRDTTDDDEPVEWTCGTSSHGVWYRYTAPSDGSVSVSVSPTQIVDNHPTPTVAVLTGRTMDRLRQIGCAYGGQDGTAYTAFPVTAGTTYTIYAGTERYGPGIIDVRLVDQEPANDFLSRAATIGQLPFADPDVDLSLATREALGEGTDAELGDCSTKPHTVWYRWTAPEDVAVVLTTRRTEVVDNRASVAASIYAGTDPASFTEVACGTSDDGIVAVPFPAKAGETYFVQVGDETYGDPGRLDVALAEQSPANDFFELPALIVTRPFVDRGLDLRAATTDEDEPRPDCVTPTNTVWYTLDPVEDGTFTATVTVDSLVENRADIAVAAFEGDSLDAFRQLACVTPEDQGGPATISFPVAAGRHYRIQLGADRYGRPGIVSLTVPGTQTVTLEGPPDVVFGVEPITLVASSSSGLPVSLEGRGACMVEGLTASVTRAGTCTITATQEGDPATGWLAAEPVEVAFEVAPAAQTIAFAALPDVAFGAPDLELVASATSGLPVSFTAEGACSVEGTRLSIDGAGTCTVTAMQDGEDGWAAAPDVAVTFAITPAIQAITFPPLADRTWTPDPVVLGARATSGLPIDYTASGTCQVTDGALELLAAGDCSVTATQPGDAGWLPAKPVTLTLAIAPASQTIDIAPVTDLRWTDQPVAVMASATSGLPVELTGAGVCTVVDGMLDLAAAGRCTLLAEQPGDARHAAAPPVTLEVLVAPAAQAIAFDPLDDRLLDPAPVELAASATSGLPVTFAASGACAVDGTSLTLTGGGTCTVTATQPGDERWETAAPVERAFEVTAPATGQLDLTGTVATELPATFVAPDATITSLLDVSRRPAEYFGVAMRTGEDLVIRATAPGHELAVEVAYPDRITPGGKASDLEWVPVTDGYWLASIPGVFVFRVSDISGGSGAYRYTVTFARPAAPGGSPEASPSASAVPG